MKTSEFDYRLPEELIAQKSVEPRDNSRLLVLSKTDGSMQHRIFRDILEFLQPNDLLVFNDTKVFKARLFGLSDDRSNVEIFLIHPIENEKQHWLCLGKPGKKLKIGSNVELDGELSGKIVSKNPDGSLIIDFKLEPDKVIKIANLIGQIPVPPYVHEAPKSEEKYQTVYAQHTGSVAAPTAGFHFTKELFTRVQKHGVQTAFVTLHVGLGTFQPIKSETLEEHPMHSEWAQIPESTLRAISAQKAAGRRVIAVGTTTVRALEGLIDAPGTPKEGLPDKKEGWVNIFIKPGYKFRVIDGLITNFHLPKSTLLALVSAFGGSENIKRAYGEAINQKYRFYSFGDAMMIL